MLPKPSLWEAVLLVKVGGTCRWLGGSTQASTQAGGTQVGDTHFGFSAALVPQLPDRVHQLH